MEANGFVSAPVVNNRAPIERTFLQLRLLCNIYDAVTRPCVNAYIDRQKSGVCR